jgi:isopenicillin N synthase-like dioxygenase
MPQIIPIIDVRDYLAGQAGALETTSAQVRDALTTVGFFVLPGHDVPRSMIDRTFAQAVRFHDLPMSKKLGLKLNEHVNGYMGMSRYAVWTSEVNKNDKPDLNEAFFVKRERAPDDPLRLSGRRFVGPNLRPDEADLPGFRTRVLEYADQMDDLTRRFLPAVAVALDLEPTWFDAAFTDSQFHAQIIALPAGRSRSEPVRYRTAYRQQLHDVPRPDRGPGVGGAHAFAGLARCALYTGLVRGQFRRHHEALDQWPLQIDAA